MNYPHEILYRYAIIILKLLLSVFDFSIYFSFFRDLNFMKIDYYTVSLNKVLENRKYSLNTETSQINEPKENENAKNTS